MARMSGGRLRRPTTAEVVAGTSVRRRAPAPFDLVLGTLSAFTLVGTGRRGLGYTSDSSGDLRLVDFTDEPVGSFMSRSWNGDQDANEGDRMLLRYGGMGLDSAAGSVPIRLGSGGTPTRTAGQAGAFAWANGIPEFQRVTALGAADTYAGWHMQLSTAYLRPMRVRGWIGRASAYTPFGAGDTSRYGLFAQTTSPATAGSYIRTPTATLGIGLWAQDEDNHELHLCTCNGVDSARTPTGIEVPVDGAILGEFAWGDGYAYWRAWDADGTFLGEGRTSQSGIPADDSPATAACLVAGGYRLTANVAATFSVLLSAVEYYAGPRPGGWR